MKIIQHYVKGADHTYALQMNDVTVIALADGKGNTYGAMGAEILTKTISEYFCDNFDRFYNMRDESEMKKVFVDVCQSCLKTSADKNGIDDIGELSSTLLVVAAKGNKALVCHIGDGAIGKIMEKATRAVSAPYKDGLTQKTCLITSPEAEEYLTIQKCKIDNVVAFFMMNDDLTDSAFDKHTLCFQDSARKMCLMAMEEDGEAKLAEMMINSSSESNNCSFIAMVFDERVTSQNVGVTERKYEGLYERSEEDEISDYLDKNFSEEKNDDEEYELSFPVDENRKKYKLTAVLVAIILAVITVFCIVIAKSASDKKGETANRDTTTSLKNEESYETETDSIINSTTDTTEEFSENVTEDVVEIQTHNTTTEKASTTENSTVETTTEKEEDSATEESVTEKTTEEKETTTAVTTTEPTTESTTSPVTEPVSETQNSNNGMLEDLLGL